MRYACLRCGRITSHRYCKAHRRKDSRPSSTARGYDRKWEQTRTRYLSEHSQCECGCGRPATDVHHLDGLGPLGPLGHDPRNLEALAHGCHSQRTATEQPAGWNAP